MCVVCELYLSATCTFQNTVTKKTFLFLIVLSTMMYTKGDDTSSSISTTSPSTNVPTTNTMLGRKKSSNYNNKTRVSTSTTNKKTGRKNHLDNMRQSNKEAMFLPPILQNTTSTPTTTTSNTSIQSSTTSSQIRSSGRNNNARKKRGHRNKKTTLSSSACWGQTTATTTMGDMYFVPYMAGGAATAGEDMNTSGVLTTNMPTTMMLSPDGVAPQDAIMHSASGVTSAAMQQLPYYYCHPYAHYPQETTYYYNPYDYYVSSPTTTEDGGQYQYDVSHHPYPPPYYHDGTTFYYNSFNDNNHNGTTTTDATSTPGDPSVTTTPVAFCDCPSPVNNNIDSHTIVGVVAAPSDGHYSFPLLDEQTQPNNCSNEVVYNTTVISTANSGEMRSGNDATSTKNTSTTTLYHHHHNNNEYPCGYYYYPYCWPHHHPHSTVAYAPAATNDASAFPYPIHEHYLPLLTTTCATTYASITNSPMPPTEGNYSFQKHEYQQEEQELPCLLPP